MEKAEVKEKKETSKVKYYKSFLAGLKVMVSVDPYDATMNIYERFVPYKDVFKGEAVKIGYLKTDNKVVIEKLVGDHNVEVISKDEFEKATKELKRAGY
jgi:hypothetical protein